MLNANPLSKSVRDVENPEPWKPRALSKHAVIIGYVVLVIYTVTTIVAPAAAPIHLTQSPTTGQWCVLVTLPTVALRRFIRRLFGDEGGG